MKLRTLIDHPRFRFWTWPIWRGFGFVWRIGHFDVSGSIKAVHTHIRRNSHVLFTWFHFYAYIYVCINVILMAYRGETEKSINWGLIAVLIKPTDDENKIIGK